MSAGALLVGIVAGCFHGGELPYATCEVPEECRVALSSRYGYLRVGDEVNYYTPRYKQNSDCPQETGAETSPTCLAVAGTDQ